MITEYGADTVAGLHDTAPVMFTEEYQVEYYRANSRILDDFPFVVGEHVWSFADFSTSQGASRVQGKKRASSPGTTGPSRPHTISGNAGISSPIFRRTKALSRNKCHNDCAVFLACAKAEKRRNTWCISSFDNEGTGRKDKQECGICFWTVPKETLNKSPRTFGVKFCARLRYKNLEIHKVFLRFLRLGGHKICSPTARVALISVSLSKR